MNNIKYAYAVGRIRALESRLLTKSKISRLIESLTIDDVLKNLQDTDYAPYLPEKAQDYEITIHHSKIYLYNLLSKLIDKEFLCPIKLKYDYFNAKVMIKGAIAEKAVDDLLSEFGNIPKEEFIYLFKQEKYDKFNYLLNEAIPEAISLYYLQKEPRIIDITLDKFYYKYLVNNLFNEMFNLYIKTEIDVINIKTFLRIKLLNEERSLFEKAFIDNGFLDKSRFLNYFAEPLDTIARYFEYTPYFNIIKEGIEYLQQNNSFMRLEKLCDNYLINYWRQTRYIAFGIEPILSYFYAKTNEFKILRLIFVGKINNLPNELIKERLPEVFNE